MRICQNVNRLTIQNLWHILCEDEDISRISYLRRCTFNKTHKIKNHCKEFATEIIKYSEFYNYNAIKYNTMPNISF